MRPRSTAATPTLAEPEPRELVETPVEGAQQSAEEEGLSFAATPGPGNSEGGDIYEPEA